MNGNSYHVIGVMSGTSLDGLDVCYAHFEFQDDWKFNIIKAETLVYTDEWTLKLSDAINLNPSQLERLDVEYTNFLAVQIDLFIRKNQITELDAICSHGHTVLHQPEKQITYQIGNLKTLSSLLGKTLVCNFRVQDVALGGQGAPLVPIGDQLLFNEYDICLNLGGFANLSFDKNEKRIAFDVCPVNIVLNYYAKKLGSNYDTDGEFSKRGMINQTLLDELNGLRYYQQTAPKSLGIEWVKTNILPLINSFENSDYDILRTLVEHIAIQISKTLNFKPDARILVSGGGAYNKFLMERLKELTSGVIVCPSNEIINFKEALIFGFLGVLKLRNETNCLSSVTGAKHDHSSGMIFRV